MRGEPRAEFAATTGSGDARQFDRGPFLVRLADRADGGKPRSIHADAVGFRQPFLAVVIEELADGVFSVETVAGVDAVMHRQFAVAAVTEVFVRVMERRRLARHVAGGHADGERVLAGHWEPRL